MGTMCKVCWEMVNEGGSCKSSNPNLQCGMDFGQGVEAAVDAPGSGGLSEDVLPAGAWTGAPSSFEPYTDGKGQGYKKVYAKCVLSFKESKDVPGSKFQLICPMQKHVNPKIVNAKVEAFAKKKPDVMPVVPVVHNKKTGKVTINGDGHHTFVACLKSRTPVCLLLYKMPYAGTHQDWSTCTYKEFALNPGGATGTRFA